MQHAKSTTREGIVYYFDPFNVIKRESLESGVIPGIKIGGKITGLLRIPKSEMKTSNEDLMNVVKDCIGNFPEMIRQGFKSCMQLMEEMWFMKIEPTGKENPDEILTIYTIQYPNT